MTGFTLPPWSFSLLEMFDQCPKKAFHRYILKEKEPETEEQRKGNLLDKAIEARIQKGTPLPEEWAYCEPLAASVALLKRPKVHVSTQLKMGLNREFKPWKFFDAGVWGRGVLDVSIIDGPRATVIDWKTGKNNESKPYYNGGLQLKIFAAFIFKHYPEVQQVTAFNVYLKTNEFGKPHVFRREDEAALWQEILPRVIKFEKAFAAMAWPEQPSGLCGWCAVKMCPHNRS